MAACRLAVPLICKLSEVLFAMRAQIEDSMLLRNYCPSCHRFMECFACAGAAPGRHHNETAKFLSQATKEVYGAEGAADASLADRVGRRKYFMERGRGEDAGAFQR